jgi:hypothetical protein
MKKILLFGLLIGLFMVACSSDDSITEPSEPPTEESGPGQDDSNNPDDPNDPNDPNNPNDPGDDDSNGPGDDSFPDPDDTLYPYEGERASDAAEDVVDSTDDDYYENTTFKNTVTVRFNGETATVDAPTGVLVYTDGAYVAVDLETNGVKACEIIATGTTENGSLKIYSGNKFKLTLNGVTIVSKRGPAINNQSKKRTFVHLVPETVSTLIDVAQYSNDVYYPSGVTAADEDRKGCFFSEAQLILSGTGVLQITGNYKHALATDDYFRMRHGVTLAVYKAVGNGIQAKDGVQIDGGLLYSNVSGEASKSVKTDGNITINGGDLRLYTSGNAYYDTTEADTSSPSGLKSNGDIVISGGRIEVKSTGTGGKGINSDGKLTVTGGIITVATTGGQFVYNSRNGITSSPKGIKSDGEMLISGGDIEVSVTGKSEGSEGIESKSALTFTGGRTAVYAYDDAINASNSVAVSGGYLYCYSVNGDGLDSNGTITISGGVVIASGTQQPETGFDCDQNRFSITGGVLIGTGGSTSTPTSSACTQCAAIYNGFSATKDVYLQVKDSSGNSLLVYKLPRTMSSMCLLLSFPELTQSTRYTLTRGGSVSGEETWKGYYASAQYSGGTTVTTFTQSSRITTVGGSSGGGGGWGGRW